MRELAKTIGVPNNIITKKSSPNLWKGHNAEEETQRKYHLLLYYYPVFHSYDGNF